MQLSYLTPITRPDHMFLAEKLSNSAIYLLGCEIWHSINRQSFLLTSFLTKIYSTKIFNEVDIL